MNSVLPLPFLTKSPAGEGRQVRADCSSATGINSGLPSSPYPVALSQRNSPGALSEVL